MAWIYAVGNTTSPCFRPSSILLPAESSSYAAVSNFHKDPLTGLIYGGRCNLNHMLIYLLLWSQGNNAPVIPAQAGI